MKNAIVVISFDGYKDIWNTFFECFWKFWPECTLPVYLITNNEEPFYKGVTVIKTGNEVSWSRRVRDAINSIEEENLLVLLEDYFLCEKVDDVEINNYFNMFNNKWDYLRLIPIPYQHRKKKKGIYPLDLSFSYGVNLQAAIWKKNFLKQLLFDDDFSAWEFEARQKNNSKCKVCGKCMTLNYTGINYLNGIIQGKWYPKTLKKLKTLDIEMPEGNRPYIEKKTLCIMYIKNKLSHALPKEIIILLKKFLSMLGMKFVTKD